MIFKLKGSKSRYNGQEGLTEMALAEVARFANNTIYN
jgi:predicted transcriptional regulator with HTH domain